MKDDGPRRLPKFEPPMSDAGGWFDDGDNLIRALRHARPHQAALSIPGYDDLQELARGGQGVVYRATQRSTRRSVAIKVLLDGAYASPVARRRFEREIDVAAGLLHPNIVRIYDSGTDSDGRPYCVMEYVEGRGLDEVLDRELDAALPATRTGPGSGAVPAPASRTPAAPPPPPSLGASLPARLELFAKICDAVQYAHQRGVIHRDLKPSNIRLDPAGEPHVLDFGLAKATTAAAGDSVATVTGHFLGSLPWASPEQVQGLPGLVDVRTDVYALGVLLYQVLTGRFPYLVVGPFLTVAETIRQTPPTRPSTISAAVDDELETIVLKALAKEPERRYQSVFELARDVRRYLDDEPIEAKRDSAWYQVRTTLRRYRLVAAVAGVFLVVAVGVAVATTVLYSRAWRAESLAEERRALAESEAHKARRVQRFLEGMFGSLDPWQARGRDTALLRQILDEAAQRVERELTSEPEIEAAVRATIGRTYANLGDYGAAETHLTRAIALCEQQVGPDALSTLRAVGDLAGVFQERGRFAEAEPLTRRALAGLRRSVGPEHRETLTALNNLAYLLDNLGQRDAAEDLYREALAARRRRLGEEDLDTINSKSNLAQLLLDRGDLDEAAPLIAETLAVRERVLGVDHPDTCASINNAARLAQEEGRFADAEALYQRALAGYRQTLGPGHARTLMALNNLGALLRQQGRLAEAETLLRAGLAQQPAAASADAPVGATLLNTLARTLQDEGRLDEAQPLFQEMLDLAERTYGPEHPQTLAALNNLAGSLADRRRYAEALPLFQRCAAARQKTLGPSDPRTLQTRINVAATLRDTGRYSEALALFDDISAAARALPPEHALHAFLQGGRGETLCLLERYAEAETPLLGSLQAFEARLGPDHAITRHARARLFELYTRWGKPDQAAAYQPAAPTSQP